MRVSTQKLLLALIMILLSTVSVLARRRRYYRYRRRGPFIQRAPYRPVQNRPQVQPVSRINLRESPFNTIVDYAIWMQYVCEKLYRAEDWDRLISTANRLQRISRNLNGPARTFAEIAYRRHQDRYNKWRRRYPNYRRNTDVNANRFFDMIQKGQYFAAKREITKLLSKNDYIDQSDSMKSLIVVAGLIQYDGMNPKAVLDLWSNDWKLSLDEKVSALIRAKQLCIRARQKYGNPRDPGPFRPFKRINQIDARVLTNLGRNVTSQFNETNIRGQPVEIGMLNAGMALIRTDYCRARDTLNSLREFLPIGTSRREDIDMMVDRANEMCNRKQLDSTYRAFCQVGHETAFPISEAVSNGHVRPPVFRYEKMFWIRITAGDCKGARNEYNTIRRIVPWSVVARRDYLSSRFQFMERQLRSCRSVPNLLDSNAKVGRQIMSRIWNDDLNDAEEIWRSRFANRPRDYFAMLWRKVIMVARYPKSMYAPCTGNTLLTGDANTDRELFRRLKIITSKQKQFPCHQSDARQRDRCNLLWMKGAYIAGNVALVRGYAKWIRTDRNACNEAHQLVACVTLCGSGQGFREACQARNAYNRLSPNYRLLPQNRIGIDLAARLCQTNKQIVLDSFYIRHGNTPRPLSYLLRQYYKNFLYEHRSIFPHHGENRGISGVGRRNIANKAHRRGKTYPRKVRGDFRLNSPYHPEAKHHPKDQSHPKTPSHKVTQHPKKNQSHTDGRRQAHRSSVKHSAPFKHPFGEVTNFDQPTIRGRSQQSSLTKPRPNRRTSVAGINLPQDHQQSALLQAQAALCPCMTKKYKERMCNEAASRTRLIEAFSSFLRKEKLSPCVCKRKFEEKELAKSGALQVAANMYAHGKLSCPCLKLKTIKKHGIKFNPISSCSCTCKGSRGKKSSNSTVKAYQRHKKLIKRRSYKTSRSHQSHDIRKASKMSQQHASHIANNTLAHGAPRCIRALMGKFPFLKAFISGSRSKQPCKKMTTKVRKMFENMLREVETECNQGMAQAMMNCHAH